MKKDMMFAPALLTIGILLFLFRATGLIAHIAISVVGALVLIAYTRATIKNWKIPVLEVLMRVFYGIALISGIVVMNVSGIAAITIVHKIGAVLFVALLVALIAHKRIVYKKG